MRDLFCDLDTLLGDLRERLETADPEDYAAFARAAQRLCYAAADVLSALEARVER